MRFPFVSRSHHEDMVRELRTRLAEKEIERRKYLDLLGQLGWGRKIFDVDAPLMDDDETPRTPADDVMIARRPSDIVKQQNMKKLQEYEEKQGKRRRQEVMDMITAAANPATPEVTQ